MAFCALHGSVLPGQSPPALRMVEGGRCPAYELEVLSIMFRVALRTFDAARFVIYDCDMVTAIGCEPLGNFFVTIQTSEVSRSRPDCVTRRAAGRAIELLVCLG
jgi:hypothetical protein